MRVLIALVATLAMNTGWSSADATEVVEAQPENHERLKEFLSEPLSKIALKRRQTRLHMAARQGFAAAVRELLQNGLDPNAQDYRGNTALHMAAEDGHVQVIRELLDDKRTNPNSTERDKETPLHRAATLGHAQAVSALLGDPRTDPNPTDKENRTPLHKAALEGQTETVESLLVSPFVTRDPQRGQRRGWTPLMDAAEAGHVETVIALIEGEADWRLQVDDMTAMHLAAKEGRAGVLTALLLKGADANIQNDPHGETPLYYAVKKQHPQAVLTLLEGGADPYKQNDSGETPLHISVGKGLTRMLLDAAATLEGNLGRRALATVQDEDGDTALHEAVSSYDLDAVHEIVGDIVRRSDDPKARDLLLNVLDAKKRTAMALALDLAKKRPIDRIPEYTQVVSMLTLNDNETAVTSSRIRYLDGKGNFVDLKDPIQKQKKKDGKYVSRESLEAARKKWNRRIGIFSESARVLEWAGGKDWDGETRKKLKREKREDERARLAVKQARANLKRTRDASNDAIYAQTIKRRARERSAKELKQCRALCRKTYKTDPSTIPGASMCEAGKSFMVEVRSGPYLTKILSLKDRAKQQCREAYVSCYTGCGRTYR